MIHIENQGAEIASTNYWDTPHAQRGFCYLSGNAGVWRLLVPEAQAALLAEMRTGLQKTQRHPMGGAGSGTERGITSLDPEGLSGT